MRRLMFSGWRDLLGTMARSAVEHDEQVMIRVGF
jgi:hypothetical protein